MKARKLLHGKLEVFKESGFSLPMLLRHLILFVAIALKIPNKINSVSLRNQFLFF